MLFLFRWNTEDVGVRCGCRSFCPPGVYSVNDLPRMVRATPLSICFVIAHFIFSFTTCIRLLVFFFYSHPIIHASLRRHEQQLLCHPAVARNARFCQWYGDMDGPRRPWTDVHLPWVPAAESRVTSQLKAGGTASWSPDIISAPSAQCLGLSLCLVLMFWCSVPQAARVGCLSVV